MPQLFIQQTHSTIYVDTEPVHNKVYLQNSYAKKVVVLIYL